MKTLLLTLLFITASTFASPSGAEAWLQEGLLTPELIASLKSELALSADQETRMTAIVTSAREKAQPLEDALREQQAAFRKLVRKPGATPEAASDALARLLEAEAPVKQAQLRALLQLRDVLTPEQQRQAATLAPAKQAKYSTIETRVREKADKLKAAVDELGIPPTQAMKDRGGELEALIRSGDLAAADKALDELIIEAGLNEPQSTEEPAFDQQDPGDTSLDALRARYENVQASADSVISLPRIRLLLKGKEALEQAKAAEDAVAVGRILTWAEGILK